MAGAGATSGVIFGGFLCIGLIMVAIAAAIVLSIIPTFPPNNSQAGFGSEYQCDAIMLKFLYQNFTYQFQNGIVGNSTALSDACTLQLASLGVKNLAGCLLYNGRAWDAANDSSNSRRRRRQSQLSRAGMYYIGTSNIYRTVSCPKQGDRNKVESSPSLSACVRKGLQEANSLVGGMRASFLRWGSTNRVLIEVADTTNAFQAISVDTINGVPRNLAVPIANNLVGVSDTTKNQLQLGCRYVRALPISTIAAILASQTSSDNSPLTTMMTG